MSALPASKKRLILKWKINSKVKGLIKPTKFSKLIDNSLASIQVTGNKTEITGVRPVHPLDRMSRQIKKE